MENDILTKLQAQEAKIDAIYTSVEKTRKYFLINMWVTIIMFVLPLVLLVIVVPMVIGSYLESISGLL